MKPRRDLWLFGCLLVLLNLPLLWGGFAENFILLPNATGEGEWWRLVTHPWVHVSWYHLLLDGAAFTLLYPMLNEPRPGRRMLLVLGAGLGSALTSLWAWPSLASQGLCGLSGIDHGLMAITSLEMVLGSGDDRTLRRCGWISFVLVVGKSGFEAVSGQAFLAWMHFGLMGSPVAVCHAGGLLGGLLSFLLMRSVPARVKGNERSAQPTALTGRLRPLLNGSVDMNPFYGPLRTSNIQRRTLNVDLGNRESFDVGRSMLEVGRSSFFGSGVKPISTELDMHCVHEPVAAGTRDSSRFSVGARSGGRSAVRGRSGLKSARRVRSARFMGRFHFQRIGQALCP